MKKITQNLTNLKAWQSTIFAFLFLFSLTINAQEVGQEYIGNPDINTTETSPETGSNVTSGNFSGATNAGSWGFGQQGSYAPCGATPGCYSEDRMFKMFKKNGENGQQYITQTITALPAGNYDWSYWNRWGANGGVFPTWSADGDETPKFVILTDDDGDGTWTSVQDNVSTEPTGSTWYQESGTYTNDIARDVKIKFTKTGGADSSGLTNLAHLWYLDNASLAYASALAPSAISTFPWNEGFESGLDSWTDGSSTPWATDNGTDYGPGSVTEGTTSIFFNDYDYSTGSTADIMSPVLDVTSLTAPLLTFDYWDSNGSDTVEVLVSDGTTTTVAYETAAAVGEWTSISIDLTAYSSSTLQVGFRGTSVYGVSNPHVDNVVVDAAPTEPSMSVSATTDGGSATFSFDISNFTVGAAAGEGDGHIHWSIFSASDLENPIYENQMVYSTDDLTLSPLPNGDHVIVFSLVDASHQPLDPAVEATVEFSTFDGTAACDETVTYTQVANGDYTVALTAPAGQVASVTVNATMENNYDFIYVTDGAGNALNADQTTGAFTDAVYSSTDGTISVNVTNDGSVQNGDVILAFACATPTFDVTFSVNTANIEVGANGMYVGGGVLGGANAYPLTDDGTGTWSATITLDEGTAGNYIFLNSPANDSDWNTKENLDGQECGDPANYNDRTLAAVTADTTLLHCFGSCETDGTCPSPADTYATTFTVNVTDGYVDYDGNTQAIGDNIVYLNGNFNGWCGACNPMTDNGDGTWSSTVELEAGAYEYKFTVNGWDGAQEQWTADFAATEEGSCLITDGTYTNRALTVTDSAQTLSTVSWNSCTDATTGGDGCEYTIRLEDTYGDSWNGNTMDVLVNGVVVLDGVTITADDNEGDFNVFTLAVNEGDVITTFSYNEGTYVTETQYFIYNIDGSLVGSSYDGAVMQPESITVTCIVPEPGISITGITDGSTIGFGATTATFGVAVEGFSVTDDGSGDGHWHYSIDGGSAVMVYDLNDVTIDVVEGATHTILAWLVDDSHNAFDPSVESSVTFTVPSSTPGCGDEFFYDYPTGSSGGSSYDDNFTTAVEEELLFSSTNTDGSIVVNIGGSTENNYDWVYATDGAGNVLLAPVSGTMDSVVESADGTVNVYFASDTSVTSGPITFAIVCPNTELAAFLASGSWRSEAEMEGHIGVGPNGNNNSEWWNAAPWDKWQTGLYDDRWLFDNGAVFVDTGDDGAIFGKKPEIDVAFPAGDPDTAVNANNEYDYYIQDDYTDTFTLSATGAEVETVTFATIGNIGFYTSLPGQEFQILERTETTMYVRNVGSETNAWYNKLTTADALSTVDAMVLDMRIYPNPSNGSFVTIQTPVNGVKYVEVFDITGKRLINTSLSANTLDVSSMSAGMYLVKVTIEGQSKTSKLIIR